jgi:hypothetical protein
MDQMKSLFQIDKVNGGGKIFQRMKSQENNRVGKRSNKNA